jgi:hypothetical protein
MKTTNRIETIVVPDQAASERLDRYLSALPALEFSRSQIQRLIDDGLVLVDGKVSPKIIACGGPKQSSSPSRRRRLRT